MKIKKILALLLSVIICSLMLVSCGDSELGSWKDKYPNDQKTRDEITLHMYIIVGDGTAPEAITTVQNMVNQYTENNFKTTLTIHYLTESQYNDTVAEHLAADKNDTAIGNSVPQVDILLVNSKSMMDTLMADNSLSDLSEFFASNEFGTINTNIADALLDAAKIDNKLYCVPNNRVVGNYEYLVINKNVAEHLNFGPLTIEGYATYEDTADLRAAMASNGYTEDEIAANVYVKSDGLYKDEAEIEASGEWVCNVISKPTATAEDAFASAFAVSATTADAKRCFEILFALNMDAEFRNLLQYGVNITHYTVDDNGYVTRKLSDENSAYNMNIFYTGNIFKALYCEDFGWNESAKTSGEVQNLQATAE